jgi:hypothetical protein
MYVLSSAKGLPLAIGRSLIAVILALALGGAQAAEWIVKGPQLKTSLASSVLSRR